MAYTVYELARLANAVYDSSRQEIDGWHRDRWFGPPAGGGFYAALFQREELWVLAIRGTDDGLDIIPDAQIFASFIPCQLAQAKVALQATRSKVQKQHLALTGHSLGGGLAALLAVAAGLPAVTFNAPGVARTFFNSAGLMDVGMNPVGWAGALVQSLVDRPMLINIRASFDAVSLGTGPRLGRVDSIGVDGCWTAWNEFSAGLERVPLDMIANRPSGTFDTNALAGEVTRFVLCQHGMDLMERQLQKMPEYNRDLGW